MASNEGPLSAIDVVCVASWNVDLVSRVARPIARGETLSSTHFDISPGGKGSNAAVAAARQGARVGLIARVGRDDALVPHYIETHEGRRPIRWTDALADQDGLVAEIERRRGV